VKREPLKLYFVALVPDESVFGEVMALKTEIRDQFNSKAALRSPPHITMYMPFRWHEEKEARLITSLDSLAIQHEGFEILLNGFGAFPPRVIYIHVEDNRQLQDLQKIVHKTTKAKWHIYPKADSRAFRPHMTIAFRDLKKLYFFEAWREFEQRNYKASFIAANICLLKHNGKTWDILHRANLR